MKLVSFVVTRQPMVSAIASVLLLAVLPSAAVERDWWQQSARELGEREYSFSPRADGAWSAPNRAQGLRSTISETGWRLEPRDTAQANAWSVELRLRAAGRGEAVSERSRPAVVGSPQRVDLIADGVTEWFTNAPRGVEHGFTLTERPGGETGAVTLELELGGSARASVGADGSEVLFAALGRDVLRYAELLALDATGRTLPAWFEGASDTLRVRYDDRDAVYPVVVDPLATSIDWTGESDQFFAEFGRSVAAGDFDGDGFDDVVVGAEEWDNGQVSEGGVFVYYGSSSGPATTPSWQGEGDSFTADFGTSVAAGDFNGDGYDDLAVGALFWDNPDTDEGAVFVFHGSPNGLDPNGSRPIGRPSNANWSGEGQQTRANYGSRVASAGDVNNDNYDDLLVGADEYDNGHTDEGVAIVYHGSPSGLNAGGSRPLGTPLNGNWLGEADRVDTDYGFAASGAGDVNADGYDDIVIGAWNYDETHLDEGRVYVYHGSATGLQATAHWTQLGNQDDARFGIAVAGAGDVNGDGFDDVLVGADAYDNGLLDEGAAFVFTGSPAGLNTFPVWLGDSNQGNPNFGAAVAGGADVNGDSFDDIVVGAELFDNGEVDEGRVFVYLGSSTGPTHVAIHRPESDQAFAQYGRSVALGDFNGDGRADLLVGAQLYDKPEGEEGAAFVYFGCSDADRDGLCVGSDNCASVFNPGQEDADGDGQGDLCDPCTDVDVDTVCDAELVLIEGAGPGERVLVQEGTTTRYRANPTNPGISGISWTLTGYNDNVAGWSTGQFGAGYETDSGAEALITTDVPAGSFSIYTRTTFQITNPNDVETMFVGADYDDGYVVWINGIEVYRSPEMPAGDPVWNTNAQLHESSNASDPVYGELQDISFTAIPTLLTGNNVLAIGVWNSGNSPPPGSSDLLIVPRLSINRALSFDVSYLSNTVDPLIANNAWTQVGYNDVQWQRGNYGVGYDTLGQATDLIHSEVGPPTYSVYTRAHFAISTALVDDVSLAADFDDGWAAWINGVQVYRSPQLPGGTLLYNTNPTAEHESSNAAQPSYGTPINVSTDALPALQNGDNLLAIAVYNRNGPASDDLVVVPRLAVNTFSADNCLGVHNPSQTDTDGDRMGDACDPDDDNDTVLDGADNCPLVANTGQANGDGDPLGDVCDPCPLDPANDSDGDGRCANLDNCPTVANPSQADLDGDSVGDACDPDIDGDGDPNGADNCPLVSNGSQTNTDGDVNGDACDCLPSGAGAAQAWQLPSPIAMHMSRTTATWQAPTVPGGSNPLTYDLLRSAEADDFGLTAATCLISDTSALSTPAAANPTPGTGFYYLVRTQNGCPGGDLGTGNGGAPIVGRNCP